MNTESSSKTEIINKNINNIFVNSKYRSPASNIRFWLSLFILLLCGKIDAAPLAIAQLEPSQHLQLEYLVDPGGRQTLAQIRDPHQQWRPEPEKGANFGYRSEAYWFRFSLRNDTTVSIEKLLEIAYPVLDWIDIHTFTADGQSSHWRLGDKLPFAQRPVWHRNFIVPLRLNGQSTMEVYVRVRTTSSMQVPMTLWSATALDQHDQKQSLLFGLYYGGMLALLAYNLVLFIGTRDRSFLHYVLWLASIGGFNTALNGTSFQYLWPDATEWNDRALIVFLSASQIFGALFSIYMLELERQMPLQAKLQKIMILPATCVLLLSPFISYSVGIQLTIANIIVSILITIPTARSLWHMGFTPAKYFVVAWAFLFVGGFVLALNKFGILPRTIFTENAVQIGSALEATLLSLALADNFNVQRRQRDQARGAAFQAQSELLEAQRRHSAALELRVSERTEQLEQANQTLREYLARMSRMQSGAELGNTVVHELRQPLTAILSFAQAGLTILQNAANPGPKVEQALTKIRDTVRQASMAIGRMQNFIGQNQQTPSRFALNQRVADAVSWLRPTCQAAGIRLQQKLLADLPDVYGDPVLIQQVVVNLLKNAFEALANDSGEARSICVTTFTHRDHVYCRVEDNGPGIPKAQREHLFEPFHTTKAGGMGLGMKISRSILEDFGGELIVEAPPNGASLLIRLPFAEAAQATPA